MANIRPLNPLLAKKAIEEMNEVPERIPDDIAQFRSWIEKQPHLKARTSDQFLLTFLRGSKFSIEKAKQKLDKFYTLRTSMPEVFTQRDVDDPKTFEILRLGVGLKLPSSDGGDEPRISLVRPGSYDAEKYTIQEILKIGTMIGDIVLVEDDNSVVSGQIELVDLANVTAAHLFQLDPVLMKKLTMLGQEASPWRHKGLHIINAPSGFETVLTLMKSFMKEKNRKRVITHSSLESLYQHVPQKLLPVEYGGTNSSIPEIIKYWEKKLTDYRDFFKEETQYGTVESLRPGTSAFNPDTLFGTDGSFRKLNID